MNGKKNILIIDDSPLIRRVLVEALKDDFGLIEAENGLQGLCTLRSRAQEICAVLLDIVMPELDGFQVLAYIKKAELLLSVPVIMITAEESENYITLAYDMGVCEVIRKPFNPRVVRKRITNLVELYEHKNRLENIVDQQTQSLQLQTQKLIEANDLMIDALSTVIEYRSLESGQHIRRIRGLTRLLLEQVSERYAKYHLTADAVDMISGASAMHDIGKIAIPDNVLLKPGKLTQEEFEIMKTHTTKGCEILFHLAGLDNKEYLGFCHDICLYHHERFDGSGYPDGLRGDEIPITAQVVSIADAFDALTHKRVYKPAFTYDKAADMILSGECGVFSPELLGCFEQVLPALKKLSDAYADEHVHTAAIG